MQGGSRIALAAVAIGVSIGVAHAVEVHRTATVKGTPQWVWWDIGDFCEIEDWHPIVADCDDYWEDGVFHRTLTGTDGTTVIKERLLEETASSYTYEILESPLPVANYRATLSVSAGGEGTIIDWVANFDAAGVSDAEAAAVIAGIFEAGLNQIVEESTTWP
jgi:hypothetical protein